MTERTMRWRPFVAAGGALIFVGGGMHPDAVENDLPLRENFASMMAAGGWVPGHSIMAVGAALLVIGVVLARRQNAWPLPGPLLTITVVAVVANFAELIVHTAVIVDEDRLRAGETGVLTAAHLVGLVTAYPLYGITVAVVALRLAGSWTRPFWVIAAVGVIGGLCHAISAPLALITENSDYEFLFPVAGVTVSLWWIVVGLAGERALRAE